MFARLRALLFQRPATLPLGARGERAAARFLQRRGYIVLERDCRNRFGEIDLIVTDRRSVIFVEVKTRRSAALERPSAAVERRQQQRIVDAALAYMKRHRLLDSPARYDIVAVTWPAAARRPTIEHFPAAFELIDS